MFASEDCEIDKIKDKIGYCINDTICHVIKCEKMRSMYRAKVFEVFLQLNALFESNE